MLTYLMMESTCNTEIHIPVMAFTEKYRAIKFLKEVFGKNTDPKSVVVLDINDSETDTIEEAKERYDQILSIIFKDYFIMERIYPILKFWLEDKEEGEPILIIDI